MNACEAAEEKKRKRAVSGPSEGSSSGAPHDLHPTRGTAASPSTTVLGQPSVATAVQSRSTGTAAVQPRSTSTTAAAAGGQPHSTSTAAAGGSQVTTTVYTCRLPMLQL
jgi:hypothetical protein